MFRLIEPGTSLMNLLMNDPKVPPFCHFIPVTATSWRAINWREQTPDQEIGFMIECEVCFPGHATRKSRTLVHHVLFRYYLEQGVEVIKIYEVRKFEFLRWRTYQKNRLGSRFQLIPPYAQLEDWRRTPEEV